MAGHKDLHWTKDKTARDLSFEVVWIDVSKLDALWQKDTRYVGRKGKGTEYRNSEKYEEFGLWLTTYGQDKPIEMPIVGFDDRINGVAFTNGRHRFSWLRDHNVQHLPVAVHPLSAQYIRENCGTAVRISLLHSEASVHTNTSTDHPPRPLGSHNTFSKAEFS